MKIETKYITCQQHHPEQSRTYYKVPSSAKTIARVADGHVALNFDDRTNDLVVIFCDWAKLYDVYDEISRVLGEDFTIRFYAKEEEIDKWKGIYEKEGYWLFKREYKTDKVLLTFLKK